MLSNDLSEIYPVCTHFQSFYTNKLQEQMDLIKDDEAHKLWKKLKDNIPKLFTGLDIKPSLLHGDLWSGNAGTVDGNPGKIILLDM